MLSSRSDALLKASAIALLMACGGCSDILARRDTIAYSAGNSIAANRAIQIIDPYPRRSFIRGQQTDGVKAQQAVRRYLSPEGSGPVTAPASLAPASSQGAPATPAANP
ncbi:MAG: hypothetical protein JWO64_2195 [Hyphomicrobiales bacterium]|nr:hypothetical protein [Hyphomicrobiales bacterium]